VQTLKVANPLFKRGLSWAQRLNYFASIYYFFHGLPRVVYLAAPLAFLLLGVPPLRAQPLELAHYFLSYYVVAQLMMYVVAPGLRRAFWSDIYETVMSFPLSHAVLGGLLGRRREAVFQVTPKGRRQGQLELQLRLLWPHVLLLCALLAGLLKAHLWDAHDGGALLISTVWAVFNSLLLLVAVALTLQRPQRRRLLRLRRRIACSLKGRAELAQGYTLDISEEGASVCLQTLGFFFKHPEVELTLRASYGESTTVKARLLRQEPTREGMVLALKFTPYETQTKHALLRQMFSPPESWAQDEPPGASAPLLDILLPLKGLLRAFRGGRTLQRLYPRVELRSPCSLRLRDGAMLQCMSRDVSYSGLSVLLEKMPHGLPDAREVLVELPREGVKLKAQVVAVQDATVHLRVKEICSGGERWEELCRPSV
jgi:cellulose synthase (UDP-forming)